MEIRGLHILITYKCIYECDHCFVWGSPRQSGTMTLARIREILRQGKALGTVEWIYFEGGEPFLYYPILVQAAQLASSLGFQVGLVSNAFWASNSEDVLEWLRPFAGLLEDLSISSDLYHADEELSSEAATAKAAAEAVGIPASLITVAQPAAMNMSATGCPLPGHQTPLRYRGRAAETLAQKASSHRWDEFRSCPHEELREPKRVHLDPFGYVHICQGITIGNLFDQPLEKLVAAYMPERHPVIGPLLQGGPAALCEPGTEEGKYADACHLCFEARRRMRERFPEVLAPDHMYGEA